MKVVYPVGFNVSSGGSTSPSVEFNATAAALRTGQAVPNSSADGLSKIELLYDTSAIASLNALKFNAEDYRIIPEYPITGVIDDCEDTTFNYDGQTSTWTAYKGLAAEVTVESSTEWHTTGTSSLKTTVTALSLGNTAEGEPESPREGVVGIGTEWATPIDLTGTQAFVIDLKSNWSEVGGTRSDNSKAIFASVKLNGCWTSFIKFESQFNNNEILIDLHSFSSLGQVSGIRFGYEFTDVNPGTLPTGNLVFYIDNIRLCSDYKPMQSGQIITNPVAVPAGCTGMMLTVYSTDQDAEDGRVSFSTKIPGRSWTYQSLCSVVNFDSFAETVQFKFDLAASNTKEIPQLTGWSYVFIK